MAEPIAKCVIDIKLANSINQFFYKAGIHKHAYLNLGFMCPYCGEPVKPRVKGKDGKTPHFAHRKQDAARCPGRP